MRTSIEEAEPCSFESVIDRLNDRQKTFCRRSNERREFRLLGLDFIVELAPRGNGFELTQLWTTRSVDHNPCLLLVEFETIERRERWKAVAGKLSREDGDLALALLEDFMRKLDGLR